MKNIRWANPEHIGINYDNDDIVVYLDSGELYEAIKSGSHGPIGEPMVIESTAIFYVPQSVTRRQARQALLLAGKLADVQPAIDAITDTMQRGLVQIEWDDSVVFERNRPTLIALATALGMSEQDIDDLFIAASKL